MIGIAGRIQCEMSRQSTVAGAGNIGIRISATEFSFEGIAFAGELERAGVGTFAGKSQRAETCAVDGGRICGEQTVVGAFGGGEKKSIRIEPLLDHLVGKVESAKDIDA
jgi:hypothetical protein